MNIRGEGEDKKLATNEPLKPFELLEPLKLLEPVGQNGG